jgi:DeoR/GlpR family transcriptional regulator of sugar metabolism
MSKNTHKTRTDLHEWRLNKTLELASKGLSQSDISKELQVDQSTISRDLATLRQQSKENIRHWIDEYLPLEYHKALAGLDAITLRAWQVADHSNSTQKDKLAALNTAMQAYNQKIDLLSNANVVEHAIKFVESHNNHSNNTSNLVPKVEPNTGKEELESNATESPEDTR